MSTESAVNTPNKIVIVPAICIALNTVSVANIATFEYITPHTTVFE